MRHVSFWYCEHCTEEVEEQDVNYHQEHKRCGHKIEYITINIEDNDTRHS